MSTSDSTPPPGATLWASRLVMLFGVIVAVNWVAAVVLGLGATGTDLAFSLLLLVAVGISGRGLRKLERWAWFSTCALSVGGLFFVAPVTGTILLGGGTAPVGTGWDVVFFPLITVVLLAVIALLRSVWREIAGHGRRHD